MDDVDATSSGAAVADVYGKLFHHVGDLLRSFRRHLSVLLMNFRLLQADALQLPKLLGPNAHFSRIEVNITMLNPVPLPLASL